MQPSHRKKLFEARKIFTNRESPIRLFKDNFDGSQSTDDYKVIVWHGIGGQGKSALAREIKRIAIKQLPESFPNIKFAFAKIDLEYARNRLAIEALLSVRLQLGKTFGSSFPCFDVGFARYFSESQPGVDIRQRHPELFKGENELLQDLIDLADDEIEKIFGLGALYKYAMRKGREAMEWYNQHGKDVLADLDQLDEAQIVEHLPKYLGADICSIKENFSDARIAIAFDTYEAFWRDYKSTDTVTNAHADAWVRKLVKETPGILILIFGRDKLRWDEIDTDFLDVIDTHLLNGLSNTDAELFLKRVPIDEKHIRDRIIASSEGLPFYLDVQVDQYEKLRNENKIDLEAFATTEAAILPKFWNHLEVHEQEYARYASYPFDLSENIMNELAKAFPGALGLLNWGWLKRQCFINEDDVGKPSMHNLMKSMIQNKELSERPERYRDIHKVLFENYRKDTQPENVGGINIHHEHAIEAAIRHRWLSKSEFSDFRDWFNSQIEIFRVAERTALLERICVFLVKSYSELLGEEHSETLVMRQNLALMIGDGPQRYNEAEKQFQDILKIQCNNEALGESHPNTLSTRHNLAQLIAKQGRFIEAEKEFRDIWFRRRRSELLGNEHPHTLYTHHELAHILSKLGRYQEAEKEFRELCEIKRRPNIFGETHPSTLITRHGLALQIGEQERYQEAEKEFRELWEIARRPEVLGNEHIHVLATEFQIGKMLDLQDLSEQADRWLIGLEDKMSSQVAEDHHSMVELRAYMLERISDS